MDSSTHQHLILSLLQANLTNEKLLLGLSDLHLSDQGTFSVDMAEAVLSLIGFEDPRQEFVNEYYALQMARVREVSVESGVRGIRILAETVYNDLVKFKAHHSGMSTNTALSPTG
ncbi:MAG: hypothetical protein V4616_05010 [Bacteroidota bacterium]